MQDPVYHLVLRSLWEANPSQDYATTSLTSEGFIHCSKANQVAWAANRFYREAEGLLLLTIDATLLSSPLKEEPAAGDVFPHIYGPINRSAVVAVRELRRDAAGLWMFDLP